MSAKEQLQDLKRKWLNQAYKDTRKCSNCGKVGLAAGKSRAKQVCFSCYLVKMVKLK